jgi:hypothetical protein
VGQVAAKLSATAIGGPPCVRVDLSAGTFATMHAMQKSHNSLSGEPLCLFGFALPTPGSCGSASLSFLFPTQPSLYASGGLCCVGSFLKPLGPLGSKSKFPVSGYRPPYCQRHPSSLIQHLLHIPHPSDERCLGTCSGKPSPGLFNWRPCMGGQLMLVLLCPPY